MEKWASGADTRRMSGARAWPDLYARSQVSTARGCFVAAIGLLAACSLEVRGTGAPASIGGGDGVVSEPGTVVIENGQPTNGRGSEPAQERDAQSDEASATADRDAGAEASEPRDASVDTSTTTDTGTSTPGQDAGREPACALEGKYALRVALDVNWVGTEFVGIVPIIDPGEGELSFTVLMELSSKQDKLTSSFRTCASDVPEFVAAISRERYQAHFADEVWDAPKMPTYSVQVNPSCREPGCQLSFTPLNALIGAQLSSPTAPWPERPSGGEWPDHDGDGAPGIAVEMLDGGGRGQGSYALPPLDLLSLRRVRSIGLGLRVIVGLDGKLESCDAMRGPTRESSVETRAASCEAQPGNQECTSAELSFLNENLPVWTVREGTFEAKRLAPDADCQAVRRAFRSRVSP